MDYNTPSSALWTGQSPSTEKSSQILIREYPHRAIAIASNSHALILRHSNTTSEAIANGFLASIPSARTRTGNSDIPTSKCMVEFSPTSKSNKLLEHYRPLTPRPIYGTLGLISVGRDVFLCVITQASRVATIRPFETVERIDAVQFFCLNSAEYDDVIVVDPYDLDSDAASVYGQPLGRREITEHPCHELQKLLGNGTFYYSTDFDVTNRMQDRPADAEAFNIDNFDESFLWNSFMIRPLVEFRSRLQQQTREALDASRILTSAIRGFCKTWSIPQGSAPLGARNGTGLPSYLTVISRLSCRRAGTRFNSRGIDDDGNVANFVETETTYWSPSGVVFSYAQVRGSVPVFWEQTPGLLPNQQKISITRSTQGTQPAFDKHFAELEQAYGAVHVINLLSATKPSENELTCLYREGIRHCPLSQPEGAQSRDHALLRDTEYDFHAETKGPQGYVAANQIRRYIDASADGFAYYLAQESEEDGEANGRPKNPKSRRYVVVLQQEGVFRTNCLDCLDRTNLIQTIVSQMAVEAFLGHRGEKATSDFWSRHASLWADNGDALSKIYAGTGALKSSFTRTGKMSFAGAIADVRKSATRLYHNNFTDQARQITIDTLLGRMVGQSPVILFDPISDYVAGELQRRSGEFSTNEKIHILVGTFNLNGRTDGIDEDLSEWLCPDELGSIQPEIIAVGFQEIVELNPQQIMNSDPSRMQLWEQAISRTLGRHYNGPNEKYVLLRSGQLVGAALCIFVKASVLHHIKNVEGSVKKTGMSGMAGNKGAVAIRLDYANTPICFVTAHLAAGFSNYDERNRDYAIIDHGLRFQRNRGIGDHDSVIWFGDFNYRIGLGLETAKELVKRRDLGRLFENDQLNLQMVAGLAFRFYSESRITFMPTYKYDVGSDEFDSSEKARIPAWTDRILRKGTNLRQLAYNSAPLRFSDHRPVYAVFECTVSIVKERLRDKISREIYDRRRAEVGGDTANLAADDESEDEDLIGYDAIEPGLPPSSSDQQKWWLDNGKMARSSISPPKPESPAFMTILNPKRPTNPYHPTDEPDWVNVPRSESRLSSFSSMSTSPYEHVNHSMLLSSSASNSAPRKLPPPYDPSALPVKFGRKQISEEPKTPSTEVAPPPPPPRRQNTMSSMNTGSTISNATASLQLARKPVNRAPLALPAPPKPAENEPEQPPAKQKLPPPVAKKPAHLAGPTPSASSVASGEPADLRPLQEGFETLVPELPRRSTASIHESLSSIYAGQNGHNGRDGRGSTSSLPFRNESPRAEEGRPQLPRRTNSSASIYSSGRTTPAGGIPLPGLTGQSALGRKPQLPMRKPTIVDQQHKQTAPPAPASRKTATPKATAVDLLGDDAGIEMGEWEALKPTTY